MRKDASSPPIPASGLSPDEIERYSRHLLLPEISVAGQVKLKNAKVLCVGAGGLGSPLIMYLAAAGVGRIGLVDFDVVDVSNLQRQVIHGTKDVGRSKLHSAKERLEDINPHVQVDLFETSLSAQNALEILEPYDVVIDGTDNFPTRYLVNDACVLLGKPNVHGSIFRFDGQISVFWAAHGPCYRCLYPEQPPAGLLPNCAEGGVLGVLPGIVGILQATEAIKLILGIGDPLIGRLKLFDALSMIFKDVKLRKDPGCPACGVNRTLRELVHVEQFCQTGLETTESEFEIPPGQLSELLRMGDEVALLDVREPHEAEICRIPGATLLPVAELPWRLGELQPERDIVVYCRSGARSALAVKLLRDAGFNRAKSLAGGILAWSEQVDASVPKY